MHNNLSDLFNLAEIKKFIYKRNSIREECRTLLMDEKYQEASQVALKLFDASPSYLFISYFLLLKSGKESIEKLLEVIVDRDVVSPDVALLLAKEDLYPHIVIKFLDNCVIKDYIYEIIKKEMIIRGHVPFEEAILDVLDDWDLYEYALKNKIDLKVRDTVNYEFYVAHKDAKCTNSKLFIKIKNYKELEYLSKLTFTTEHEDYVTNCMLKFINFGFNLEKAKEIYENFKKSFKSAVHKDDDKDDAVHKDKDNTMHNTIHNTIYSEYNYLDGTTKGLTISDKFNLLKVLLGHLIASKDTQLLIFALFLARVHRKSFTTNYEISIIYLFLCRFFLFYKEIDSLFFEFNIKNNQFYSLFFIWSDVAIVLGIEDKSREEEYLNLVQENIKTVEKSLKHFIEKDKIGHALSLLTVHKKLKNEVVSKEIKNKKIYSEESRTIFSDLLGKDCGFLFRKLTKEDKLPVMKKKTLMTLSNSLEYEEMNELFRTPLGEIKDSEFIEWFKSGITLDK